MFLVRLKIVSNSIEYIKNLVIKKYTVELLINMKTTCVSHEVAAMLCCQIK